jgi:hypothetical protein
MTLQFPASPSLNQQYVGPNGLVYYWDGEKWITIGSGGTDPANYLRTDIDDTYGNTITSTSTTAFGVPVGTTQEQPVGVEGMVRYNTTLDRYEGFSDGSWGALGGGATGGGSDRVFQTNTMEVTTDFTLPDGESALSAGPITIDDGATVEIPDNQNWVIL